MRLSATLKLTISAVKWRNQTPHSGSTTRWSMLTLTYIIKHSNNTIWIKEGLQQALTWIQSIHQITWISQIWSSNSFKHSRELSNHISRRKTLAPCRINTIYPISSSPIEIHLRSFSVKESSMLIIWCNCKPSSRDPSQTLITQPCSWNKTICLQRKEVVLSTVCLESQTKWAITWITNRNIQVAHPR